MRKTLLFDLDGTLSDPILGTINCIKIALTQMGKELPARETLNTFIGPPLHESFEKHCGMTSEEAWEAVRLYRVRYGDVGLFENEIAHFVSCAGDGIVCRAPAEDGVTLMDILDAAYESARTGHEVVLAR